MNRLIFLVAALLFLLIGQNGQSAVYWDENFDGFTKNWSCGLSDCALNPGLPPGYVGFGSNTMCRNYGQNNTQITTLAERTNPGTANKRGFRIYLEEQCWPTGENILKKDLGGNRTLIYLRWYQRDSVNSFSNFQKLFRLKQTSNQILIPEFQVNGGHVQMNLWDAQTNSNHFFTGYNLDTDYTPGTWVCYEIKIDLVNKRAEFWVDGVSRGTLNATWWPSGWYIRYIELGGNQYGQSWVYPTEETRDYDDIAVADAYIGPGDPTNQGPVPPQGLRVLQ
jgi:hypothetical protein